MDVSRCYESITPETVGKTLGALRVSHAAVVEIVGLLGVFRQAGVTGLPVGPEPSAILANVVLAAVDEELRAKEVAFVRWVDDLVLSAPGAASLAAGERAVEMALAEMGLVSNPEKHRRFVDPGAARAFILGRGTGASGALEIIPAP